MEVGKLVLDRNPENYFADVEQSAFNPANYVPGIGPSPDKMLQGRLFAYADTQRYRLGVNHTQLPVNQPHAAQVANYGRDGLMRFDGNGGGSVNYEPNSRGGPAQTGEALSRPLEIHGIAGAQAQEKHKDDDDFVQAGALYRVMKEDERDRLVANLAGSFAEVRDQAVVDSCISYLRNADKDYGARVEKAVKALKALKAKK
jgi:catalase